MKRLVKLLILCGLATAFAACDQNKGTGNNGGNTPTGEYYEFPLKYEEAGFEAKDNGLSILVSEIAEQNIIFNLDVHAHDIAALGITDFANTVGIFDHTHITGMGEMIHNNFRIQCHS